MNTYKGEQDQQSFGSADANTSSINDTQQNRSSTVNQEPLKMDMSGSEHKVPVEEKNANKKEKLIRRPRLKLKKYVTEAFKEVKLQEKITFEVTDARGEREEETGISNF